MPDVDPISFKNTQLKFKFYIYILNTISYKLQYRYQYSLQYSKCLGTNLETKVIEI
jgi:hypothetical protein